MGAHLGKTRWQGASEKTLGQAAIHCWRCVSSTASIPFETIHRLAQELALDYTDLAFLSLDDSGIETP